MKETKQAMATVRKTLREQKEGLQPETRTPDTVTHFDRYMLTRLASYSERCRIHYVALWQQDMDTYGFRSADCRCVTMHCRKQCVHYSYSSYRTLSVICMDSTQAWTLYIYLTAQAHVTTPSCIEHV